MAEIFIFKTDISAQEQLTYIGKLFQSNQFVQEWSVDLEDCDRILRIVVTDLSPGIVEELLATAGIRCEQLEYEL